MALLADTFTEIVEHTTCPFCVSGLFFLGVHGEHGDGIGHDDTLDPVVALDINGLSAAFNHDIRTLDEHYGHYDVEDEESAGVSAPRSPTWKRRPRHSTSAEAAANSAAATINVSPKRPAASARKIDPGRP